ncbi:hypothetical protein E2C01_085660 [Portunus trituberculatus]|uniref:Uncharacterized protein n=1 Tax=Portunus trituberculatus TaxID=210409 RepID=A0A5B7J867_PORTR|nr:hypothetical protein [Portunus trituberculatus]
MVDLEAEQTEEEHSVTVSLIVRLSPEQLQPLSLQCEVVSVRCVIPQPLGTAWPDDVVEGGIESLVGVRRGVVVLVKRLVLCGLHLLVVPLDGDGGHVVARHPPGDLVLNEEHESEPRPRAEHVAPQATHPPLPPLPQPLRPPQPQPVQAATLTRMQPGGVTTVCVAG